MVRYYKAKSKRQNWSVETIKCAINDMMNNANISLISETYGIPKQSLGRIFNKYKKAENKNEFIYKESLGCKPVFTQEQEKLLANYILENEKHFHGFTSMEVRGLAYDLAEKLEIQNKFNKDTRLAGIDWFNNFIKRNPHLSLRKPEATSSARVNGFNQQAVQSFFIILQDVYEKYNFTPDNIYNMDETGISCNPKSYSKIVSVKGKRYVGTRVSAERGTNVTAVICFSASGRYMGPLLIFPRKIENATYLNGAPPGSFAEFNQSGWMEENIFTRWLQKFIHFSNASKTNKVLLLLDGHATHVKNIAAIDLAQENGVVMVCFPPHCTHRLQPLDVSYMKPLSVYYTSRIQKWMRDHPGDIIRMKDIASIFGEAFIKASSMETAFNGFRKTGIYPLNINIFEDEFSISLAASDKVGISSTVFENTGELLSNKLPNSQSINIMTNEKTPRESEIPGTCIRATTAKDYAESIEIDITGEKLLNNVSNSQILNVRANENTPKSSEIFPNITPTTSAQAYSKSTELQYKNQMSVEENIRVGQNLKSTEIYKKLESSSPLAKVNDRPMEDATNSVQNTISETKILEIFKTALKEITVCVKIEGTDHNSEGKKKIVRKRRVGKSAEITTDAYKAEVLASKEQSVKKRKIENKTSKVAKSSNPLSDVTNIIKIPGQHLQHCIDGCSLFNQQILIPVNQSDNRQIIYTKEF